MSYSKGRFWRWELISSSKIYTVYHWMTGNLNSKHAILLKPNSPRDFGKTLKVEHRSRNPLKIILIIIMLNVRKLCLQWLRMLSLCKTLLLKCRSLLNFFLRESVALEMVLLVTASREKPFQEPLTPGLTLYVYLHANLWQMAAIITLTSVLHSGDKVFHIKVDFFATLIFTFSCTSELAQN